MKRAAIVTGGGSAAGLAAAERLLDEGWPVAVMDADADALAEAEARLGGAGAVFIEMDTTDEEETAEAFDQAVDALGPVGALVTAASVARVAPLETMPAELLREALEVNLVATFVSCRAAIERMADRLSIVTMGSAAAFPAAPFHAGLAVSGAGVAMLTQAIAVEFAERGVRANCVAPALPAEAAAWDWEAADAAAAAIIFLLSEEARHVNGQVLALDGGLAARVPGGR